MRLGMGFGMALNGATATSGYTAEATALFAAMTGTLTAVKLLTIGCIL